ncbi:MAG: Pyridinium-3,5-bisthiocarboxylic acid mononucleotide nickel insertion protein [Phycisphaerae bacterium]|nr:Pyridinium-3,5-bisthiocarboxylic acid mononucleotide nickel insertion protein [Phycisphaerae bacterium]
MAIAYFDCYTGASGDMILGAMIDAGLDADLLAAELDRLHLPGFRIRAAKVVKQGFAATQFEVLSPETGKPVDLAEHPDLEPPPEPQPHAHGKRSHSHDHAGPHRHLDDIRRIIQGSDLATPVKQRAVRIFTRLAEAEARAHGIGVDEVHFHEVGAVDAIVDVVGASIGVELLHLSRIVCSPLPPGSGTVKCAHGEMPVPTPATAELLKGVPLAPNRNPGELLTPTGAAILTTLADEFSPAPPPRMTLSAIGVGAGTREGRQVPNLLRLMIGQSEAAPADESGPTADTVTVMETNLDDMDGEAMGHCFELLLRAGALDVWATPIVMKKNRPAYMLSVMCESGSDKEAACRGVLFRHTSTFGVRETRMARRKLAREQVSVDTPFGPVRVKVGTLDGEVVRAAPEFEDCRKAAETAGVPLKEVRLAAVEAWRRRKRG